MLVLFFTDFLIQNEKRLQRCSLDTLALCDARFREWRGVSLHATHDAGFYPARWRQCCARQRCATNNEFTPLLVVLLCASHTIHATATAHD